MRTFIFFVLCTGFAGSVSALGQEKKTARLIVEVAVTHFQKGSVLLALYNSESTYMKTSYRASKQAVKDGKVVFTFDHMEQGTYGFSLFHDVNGNDTLDKNMFGAPKEPYGFSMGRSGTFGPPDFSKIQFDLKEDKKILISIK